ncbi:lipocalin family protein [Vibrio tapetis]|uniref:Outer membrane lipoprotein Blc n=1 Tax=Vibrio tapetis subsp. tapetis TaxID=1671868 RepID=A0A2N8ZLZ5_9VIBR|nr:lipocalin family protein [Vibrio tapetis]SON52920.1 outer membrane lipoprotein (lipocalin) [Vibrio tapetis subsp. tapetis]
MKKSIVIALSLLLGGCLGMPQDVKPVNNFELNQYLGTWYEIARLDHSFERGLSNVTAEYRLKDDGGVTVINRGYSKEEGEWQQAEGKAYFVEQTDIGYLKVSFFGPFYGSYVVFELDEEQYQYAFVAGPNTDYLWLLSRTSEVDPDLVAKFMSMAKQRGFDTDQVILVDQGGN